MAKVICTPETNSDIVAGKATQYLRAGVSQLAFIVSIKATDITVGSANVAVIIGMDYSPSMNDALYDTNEAGRKIVKAQSKLPMAKQAACKAIDDLPESAYFSVIKFTSSDTVLFEMAIASKENKEHAKNSINRHSTDGGTNIACILDSMRRQAQKAPAGAAITGYLLTDGDDNNGPDNPQLLRQYKTPLPFQLEARGFGSDYNVKVLQHIANTFGGREKLIRDAAELPTDMKEVIGKAMTRGLQKVRLHLWAPRIIEAESTLREFPDPKVERVKDWQVPGAPDNVNDRYLELDALGEEEIDYCVQLKVAAKDPGQSRTACRISLCYEENGKAQETDPVEVIAMWTSDPKQSGKVSRKMAHYKDADGVSADLTAALEQIESNPAEASAKLSRARAKAVELGDKEKVTLIDELSDVQTDGSVKLKRAAAANTGARKALSSASVRRARAADAATGATDPAGK